MCWINILGILCFCVARSQREVASCRGDQTSRLCRLSATSSVRAARIGIVSLGESGEPWGLPRWLSEM